MEDFKLTQEELEAQQAVQVEAQRKAIIETIKAAGYKGDGSVEDFERLMNKPEIFGVRWKELAKVNAEEKGIEGFISMFLQYNEL